MKKLSKKKKKKIRNNRKITTKVSKESYTISLTNPPRRKTRTKTRRKEGKEEHTSNSYNQQTN